MWLKSFLLLLHMALVFADADPRIISYENLMETSDEYVHYRGETKVTNYSTFLFDMANSRLYVGARDTILKLSLSNLSLEESALWITLDDHVQQCVSKGQTEAVCHNYIKVLLTDGQRIFACGTNALSPLCSWREKENINRVTDWVLGMGKCPYNPHYHITSLMTSEGLYFAGSPMDYSAADTAIIRDLGNSSRLRTNQYNPMWLNEAHFVGSFETESHVYFLFREGAVEYINCGKVIYSRIARICKNDKGGQLVLRQNWTTFVKARLNCSLPGEYPFYFDNIQGMVYHPEHQHLYATFTTPENSIAGSAICAFNMSAIEDAFDGPYKYQEKPDSTWKRTPSSRSSHHSKCAGTPQSVESSRYQLMDDAVQPVSITPLYHSQLEKLTHIAVDVTKKKHAKNAYGSGGSFFEQHMHVIYVATTEGTIKKMSLLPKSMTTCVLEVWKPFDQDTLPIIHSMKLAMGSLYLGTDDKVLRIRKEHCHRYTSRTSCVGSMDPHCGWHEHKEMCTPFSHKDAHYWRQEANRCPLMDIPVDGSWSAWSPWSTCQQADSDSNCLCSTRTCDNPAPRNGGVTCHGASIRVTNCTVHGNWSPWSPWSSCSQTCGTAVKTKRRICGNPPPQHGGRVCVGQDRVESYCYGIPPCPSASGPITNGGWSSWGPWSSCSAECGGGFRMRRRTCDDPPPQRGGLDCIGCGIDYEECNNIECPDVKKMSQWTSWVPLGNGSEKRYRFACRGPVQDPSFLKVTLSKTEERQCDDRGRCTRLDKGESEEAWSEWSAWSPCSVECGQGQQTRVRTCEGRREDCQGTSQMSRSCNAQKCTGDWSCWSDWSPCSVSCGVGIRQRTRKCLSLKGQEATGCIGVNNSQEVCDLPSCHSLEGWDSWTPWSPVYCDDNGQQHRSRICRVGNPGPDVCVGPSSETRTCTNTLNEVYGALEDSNQSQVSVGAAAGCTLLAFLIGIGTAILCWVYYQHRNRPHVPGSPHYISSKQNPYVTVPLKEVHSPKRTPSFSKQTTPTPKLFNKSGPVEYETATIKRNSHSLANGQIRADLDQDKFF